MKKIIGSGLMGLGLFFLLANPTWANYGYENEISDCSGHEAWTETSGTTLEIYMEPVAATANSITLQFVPSFNDSACTVKAPIGYEVFKGVSVKATSNIQTTPGEEEIQVVLNDTGDGELEYTFTGLEPAAEYQFRVDSLFEDAQGASYDSTTANEYYATSVDAVTGLSIDEDGVVTWTYPEGDTSSIKADIAFYNSSNEEIVSTVKYATSAGEYDYYDFANKLTTGNYKVTVTASTKKIYDLVDHRLWATPVSLYFTTIGGEVIADYTSTPKKPTIKKVTKKSGITLKKKLAKASYYKIRIETKKKGTKVFNFNMINAKSQAFTKAQKKKLKSGKNYKAKVKSCNGLGCSSKWETENFSVK